MIPALATRHPEDDQSSNFRRRTTLAHMRISRTLTTFVGCLLVVGVAATGCGDKKADKAKGTTTTVAADSKGTSTTAAGDSSQSSGSSSTVPGDTEPSTTTARKPLDASIKEASALLQSAGSDKCKVINSLKDFNPEEPKSVDDTKKAVAFLVEWLDALGKVIPQHADTLKKAGETVNAKAAELNFDPAKMKEINNVFETPEMNAAGKSIAEESMKCS